MLEPPRDNRAVAERNLKAIHDAARRLLDRGMQITISAVAAEAGLSRVTVYAHFGTREELVYGVGEHFAQRVAAAMDQAALDEGSALDALDRFLALAWQFLDQHQAIVQATGSHLSTDARRDLHGPVLVRMERLIERGRSQGSLRTDLPTEWLLASLYALIHAAADEARMGRLEPSEVPAVLTTTVHDVLVRRP